MRHPGHYREESPYSLDDGSLLQLGYPCVLLSFGSVLVLISSKSPANQSPRQRLCDRYKQKKPGYGAMGAKHLLCRVPTLQISCIVPPLHNLSNCALKPSIYIST